MLLLLGLGVASFAVSAQDPAVRGQGVAGTAAVATTIGDFHLLAIGVDGYAQWPALKTAVADAKAVTQALVSDYGFASNHVVALYNAQATRPNIITALRDYARRLRPEDSLFIFYAGHGHLDDLTGTGSWIPVEASREDASTWVDNTGIKNIIRSMKARHVLLVSDSCFSGDFFRGLRAAPPVVTDDYVRAAFAKTSRQALTSGGLEPVADGGMDGHSVFAAFLLKQLRENTSPYLLPSDLFHRIKGGVAANAKQQPILGLLDNAGGEVGGEFVFFRRGGAATIEDAIRQREAQKKLLEQMEAEARKAAAEQQGVIKAKEATLAKLAAQVEELQKKLKNKTAAAGTLDQIVSIVDEKERQAKELVRLKAEAEKARQDREAELVRLKTDEEARRKAEFEVDYEKFQRVKKSEFATPELVQAAWTALTEKWQVASASPTPSVLYWVEGKAVSKATPATATKELPFENSLGMKFVPVPGTEVLFCIWHTRVQDYGAFATATGRSWRRPGFHEGPTHPVVSVSWEEAQELAKWLTARERGTGKLMAGQSYRLPQDWEWSVAVGLNEARAGTPKEKDGAIKAVYPWGGPYPPPRGAGNYSQTLNVDDYKNTSPVGSFPANVFGLYDMGGNAWQWCEDWNDGEQKYRVLRGGSWDDYGADYLLSSSRYNYSPDTRISILGFRLVLVGASAE